METALDKLRWERRRKLQVRQAFSAGLERYRDGGGDPRKFYLACAEYLVQGQYRLVAQDLRLSRLLKERVPVEQTEDHALIDALEERLQLGEQTAQRFAAAVAVYAENGSAGQVEFERAADDYLDVIVNVLGARSHSLRHLTTTLLTDADWRYVVDITPEFLRDESGLLERIKDVAESGLDPASFSVQRPAAG